MARSKALLAPYLGSKTALQATKIGFQQGFRDTTPCTCQIYGKNDPNVRPQSPQNRILSIGIVVFGRVYAFSIKAPIMTPFPCQLAPIWASKTKPNCVSKRSESHSKAHRFGDTFFHLLEVLPGVNLGANTPPRRPGRPPGGPPAAESIEIPVGAHKRPLRTPPGARFSPFF